MAQSGTGTGGGTPAPTDIDVLTYALRLERLEAAFYAQGLAKLAATDFAKAQFASGLSSAQSGSLYANFQAIRDHEQTHVMEITNVLNQAGATLPPPDSYTFSPNGVDNTTFANADNFIQVADVLENTGTSAYDGAIRFVNSPDLREAAATIATVEARHAAYLNELRRADCSDDQPDAAHFFDWHDYRPARLLDLGSGQRRNPAVYLGKMRSAVLTSNFRTSTAPLR